MRVLAAIACVLTTLAGCDAILGIDKFEECPGSCEDASFADVHKEPDVREADAPDGDGGPPDGDGGSTFDVADVEIIPIERLWARWPMPTAETIGDASPYTDAGSETLLDPVTHLTWQRATLVASDYEGKDGARAVCATIGPEWKVPTRIELATLLDPTRDAAPAWSPTFADAGASLRLWTASRVFGTNADHWVIDFATGATVQGGGAGAVRCVRLP